ncbi:hypothetical protein ACQ86G_18260 [Roseateles chitinivorans]|uniref:hypothetical protein n=1 Tax=Roseateles chitinivorans TaxID=2917965 RepID=UPI003D670315
MARACVPGPIGLDTARLMSDPGTTWLGDSPRPGPIGLDASAGDNWLLVAADFTPPAHAPSVPAPRKPIATADGGERGLTTGEIAMARLLFKDALDYTVIKVHKDEYLPFGLQPDDTAMTPNGEMYFNKAYFKEDFSQGEDGDKHWFMHEMVHVWQHQLGYWVRLRGAIRIGLSYKYELKAGQTLGDYNMESQGDLLADYFALKHLSSPDAMSQRQYAKNLPLFEEVLKSFIANPADKANLP